MDSLKKLQEVTRRFPYAEPIAHWNAGGKKAVGWLCIYVPEELIHAAGALPVRVIGGVGETTTNEAEVHTADTTCSFVRSCLNVGLKGEYDFLDSLVASSACSGCTRLSELWACLVPRVPVIDTLDIPRKMSESVVAFYKDELLTFKQALEKQLQVTISDEALRKSIRLYNEGRRLLKQLYELRKANEPPITGAEVLQVVNAAHMMPREEFNVLLRDLLKELPGRRPYSEGGGVRLMLLGSMVNDCNFIAGLEACGFRVVVDELCTGGKYCLSGPVEDGVEIEPYEALARRYVFQLPCAREMPKELRSTEVLRLAKEYRVDGAVSLMVRYCNNVVYTQPYLTEELGKGGVPAYALDVDYGQPFTGQLRTRLEAFRERLEGI